MAFDKSIVKIPAWLKVVETEDGIQFSLNWRPVSDPPTEDGKVFVWCQPGNGYVGFITTDLFVGGYCSDTIFGQEVTHYAPMPEGPIR
jgi:hypothetical protein